MLAGRRIVGCGLLVVALLGFAQIQSPTVQAQTPTPTQTPPNPGYTTRNIGSLGGHDGYASDINDFGRVSGYSENESSDYRSFLWRRGTMTEILPLYDDYKSYGFGINDTGYIVGESGTSSGSQAFLWTGDETIGLGTLGGNYGAALDISNGERIIGYSDTANGQSHAFMWYRGTMTDLGTLGGTTSSANAINDNKVIVGSSTNANGVSRAVIWKNGQIIDLNVAAVRSYGYGINNHEQIVGTMVLTDGIARAFMWDDGVTTDLSAGFPRSTRASDINDAGIVVGVTYDLDGYSKATVWRNGTVLYMWPGSSGMDEYHTDAIAINEANQIVGNQEFSNGSYFYTDAMLWQLTE